MEERLLLKQLNELRNRLKDMISENENLPLNDPRVVAVSQEMDAIVIRLQKQSMNDESAYAAVN